ncbi:hypothetical protein [Paenibacillus sanguinis]|uniref:DUF6848 family protein n=1 Tax=Paenibacillus sanguinis TaxID=225906 RepID=UPI00038290DD|nr:hypothetical protein [Paenibacillus sanguinis]
MSEKAVATKLDDYKVKYGKVYQVKATLEPDDDTTVNLDYVFKRPAAASYDRYVKNTSQSPTKALRNFILDNIVEEQAAKLEADLEEYPALSLAIGEKLLTMLGLSKDVNLKQL